MRSLSKVVTLCIGTLVVAAALWHFSLGWKFQRELGEIAPFPQIQVDVNSITNVVHIRYLKLPKNQGDSLSFSLSTLDIPKIEIILNEESVERVDYYPLIIPWRLKVVPVDADDEQTVRILSQIDTRHAAAKNRHIEKISSYVKEKLSLENVRLNKTSPHILRGILVNNGDAEILSFTIRIYFLDEDSKRISETDVEVISVKPTLKPGYRHDFEERLNSAPPSGWDGDIQVEIKDLMF